MNDYVHRYVMTKVYWHMDLIFYLHALICFVARVELQNTDLLHAVLIFRRLQEEYHAKAKRCMYFVDMDKVTGVMTMHDVSRKRVRADSELSEDFEVKLQME